ncbi:MAG: chromosomal replication initiator protein DnaA [Elusimicrobiaceae bacterium]|nr:chromosomal replication initiator protein DnaA [Elusimicrobiaceae bacterium]
MENNDINEIWANSIKKLEITLGKDICDMWLKPMKILEFSEGVFKIEVPNESWLKTIKDRYETPLLHALTETTNFPCTVDYVIQKQQDVPTLQIPPVVKVQNFSKRTPLEETHLDPHYTFEGFIEGPSNRFAYKASEAVVKKIGNRANNPFVIFSAPGLGKTHLLHAIGNELLKNNPYAKVLYMSGEDFVTQYIEHLSKKTTTPYHKQYDNIDCFLIDDIQYLLSRNRSEEEFFYVFNSLFNNQKQIVLTCDKTPIQLGFSERLSSRLLSGISAEIKRPDLETRIAILRHKRDVNNFDISDDVLSFIAQGVQASIRNLEGCLYRLNSYASIHGVNATISIAKEVLADIINLEEQKYNISINKIKEAVCKHYKVNLEDLNSKKKNNSIAWPRQIAMYLATELTSLSLPEIGREFNRDHTTVIHAKEKVKEEIKNNTFFIPVINLITEEIKAVDN